VETTYRVILWYYVAQNPRVYDCPTEQYAVYADGISAYDASYGGFALTPGVDWSQTGIGIAGPYEASAGGDYEKWNQSGIGVAGGALDSHRWQSGPVGASQQHAVRAADAGLLRRVAPSTEISAASKLIWYGDGGCGSPTTWADDSWWIKNTDTSGNGSEDEAASTACSRTNTDASGTTARPITLSPTATCNCSTPTKFVATGRVLVVDQSFYHQTQQP
jgi:hypothetical protein